MKLLKNKAKCRACGTVIESKHRHDWTACNCFENEHDNIGIFIDGGTDYVRRGGCLENYIDLCEYEEEHV